MSGLRPKPLTPREIALGCAPEFDYEEPEFEEAFSIDYEPEETVFPRSSKQFVKKHRRREARLRAKGRII